MQSWQLRSLLGPVAVLLPALYASPALPQEQRHAGHESTLRIVADGTRSPEAIPDHLAYAHLIIAIAEASHESVEQAAYREAILKNLQLSKRDTGLLRAAVKDVPSQLAFIARETERLSAEPTVSESRLADLRLWRTRTLDEARTRITKSLSPDGLARLDAYLKAQMKPHIVIYGDQPE